MRMIQKVVKYLAIAFAIFLSIQILSLIFVGIYQFGNILGLTNSGEMGWSDGEKITINIEDTDIEKLKIDLAYSNLTIKKGEKFLIECNSQDIQCMEDQGTIWIKEQRPNLFFKEGQSKVILYLPEERILEMVEIDIGLGEVNLQDVSTKKMAMETGVGKVTIQNIHVIEETNLDGGVGKFTILSGEMNNLDFDMGMGSSEITAQITGNSKIDAGIGKLEVTLMDEKENYAIQVEKGIGKALLDGEKVSEDVKYGNGNRFVKVNGGIGSIKIQFQT